MTQFYECLLKLNKESEIATVTKAIYLKKSNDLITAREILKDMLVLKPHSIHGWMALSEISMKLYCWEDAEIAAKRILEIKEYKLKDELKYKMELILVEAMSRCNDKHKWETALQIYEQVRISSIYKIHF